MKPTEYFKGREVLIATKHQKEQVIAPIFKKLGVKSVVPANFDTDQFGTFTGERPRVKSALETVKLKLVRAMNNSNYNMGLASEGSFGPHPILPFVQGNIELVYFIDKLHDLEIWAEAISTETNFNRQTVTSWQEIEKFALDAGFPAHDLILSLKNDQENFISIHKEIGDWKNLKLIASKLLNTEFSVIIETDMRACYNPTRMKNIGMAAHKLVDKLLNCCPSCGFPGFEVTEVEKGLPCEQCGSPTLLAVNKIFICKKCNYEQKSRTKEKTADPANCDFCNP